MGRKGAKEQRELSRDEFDWQRAETERQGAERKEARDTLMPEYLRLYNESFGYEPEGFQAKLFTPSQRENIMSTSVRSARLPWEEAQDVGGQRLARTRNQAGFGAQQAELARGKSRGMADITRRTESDLTQRESETEFNRMGWLEGERFKREMGGLGGLAQLFGIDTQLLMSQLGGANRALGSHAAGIEPGLMETVVGPVLGGAAGGLSAAAGAKWF
jgi:hypothetical protein